MCSRQPKPDIKLSLTRKKLELGTRFAALEDKKPITIADGVRAPALNILPDYSANLTNDKPSGIENQACQTKPSDDAKGMTETERTTELATEPEIPDL